MFFRPPISRSELGVWIAENMPELDAELGPLTLDKVRIRLNEITGLSIAGSASIHDSTFLFLEALKAKKES